MKREEAKGRGAAARLHVSSGEHRSGFDVRIDHCEKLLLLDLDAEVGDVCTAVLPQIAQLTKHALLISVLQTHPDRQTNKQTNMRHKRQRENGSSVRNGWVHHSSSVEVCL